MATTIGKLNFLVTADASGVASGLQQGTLALTRFAGQSQGLGSSIAAGLAGGLAAGGIIAGIQSVGSAIFSAGKFAIATASEMESLSTSFEVMLGSASKAQAMLGEIRQFAGSTPLETGDLVSAAQTLLQFGVAGDEIMPTLRMLGDVSAGNAQKLKSLSLVFGQISSAGKLTGGDLLQLVNTGFNPLRIIADETGTSYGELRKKMEQGLISFDMVQEAFKIATEEGGLFNGMLDKQADTIAGKWSTLMDEVKALAGTFGEIMAPAIKEVLDLVIELAQWLKLGLEANRGLLEGIFGKGKTPAEAVNEVETASESVARLKEMLAATTVESGEGLKDALEIVRDEIRETEQMHNRIMQSIRSQRNNFTGAADRFTTAGQQAIFGSAVERAIQEAANKEIAVFERRMEALRVQEKATTDAIKENKLAIKEARI